jgi:leucyl-tRNA synthetase
MTGARNFHLRPEYYKWNQWFSCACWNRGIAYKKEPRQLRPNCRTVLANEQVINGPAGATKTPAKPAKSSNGSCTTATQIGSSTI